MSIRSVLRVFVMVFALLSVASLAAAQAEPNAPAAVRVRIAHLAPFVGSNETDVVVRIGGTAVAGPLAYGNRTNYITLPGGEVPRLIEVLRDGTVVVSETHTLLDTDTSIAVVGDGQIVPVDLLVVSENVADPGVGRAGLRITHAAAIGATIEETKVDVCSQDGVPFGSGGTGLRYLRTTSSRSLPVGDYNLKITRANAGGECSGAIVIDPPPITLTAGVRTNLFLIGNGTNRPLAVFTFEAGVIGGDTPPPPTGNKLFLPVIARSS